MQSEQCLKQLGVSRAQQQDCHGVFRLVRIASVVLGYRSVQASAHCQRSVGGDHRTWTLLPAAGSIAGLTGLALYALDDILPNHPLS